jgi:hypothetical protein
MGLITENNEQYYQGVQAFRGAASGTLSGQKFTTTFNTDLIFGSYNPSDVNYALNNFKIYTSTTGMPNPNSWSEYTSDYTVSKNVITITGALTASIYIAVQLKRLDGGNYGQTEAEKAYGDTVEENYGSYQYVKVNDVINNFMVAYVGMQKLIPNVKRTDVIFHAKRAMQEFSYDTLKSISSQELTIPPSLSLALPQDYVNYVNFSWIDQLGVKRPIYPANNLTKSPYETPTQDNLGIPTQDNFGENTEGTSITVERWKNANDSLINQNFFNNLDEFAYWANYYGFDNGLFYGQQYGLDPQYSQVNGWFNMNEREGKVSFSSNLKDKLIILEYISDGLAYDLDSKVPKMAEEAMYAYILHAIISTRLGQPEYIVQRLKKEKRAKLRNAKIRLSNIKLDEINQVMRGKSKWIKH